MPYLRIYIHVVWSTYRRVTFLDSKHLRNMVWDHMRTNAASNGISIDSVGGHSDHCHCLLSLGSEKTLNGVVEFIKGESAHWINQYRLTPGKFTWQTEYYAVSISTSAVEKVREYIRSQEIHHKKLSFDTELENFMKSAGFQVVNNLASVKAG